ncbi:hypothetical protein [Nocardia sp. NPDC049149]|uniref:hypothetical protein n=1 Tax=Nocardia sp. NPDC049149 TaxID=3364315 RepID=UPI0037156914
MSKVPNELDFLIHAEELQSAIAFDEPDLLQGGYVVGLNRRVEISFVPDASDVAPPWPVHEYNPDDPIKSAREARAWAVRVSDYSVTPNPRLDGTAEKIPLLPRQSTGPDDDPELGVVWYVGAAEWEALTAELQDLREHTNPFGDFVRFSELADTHLWRFLTRRFLTSNLLASDTVRTLSRATGGKP